MKYNRPVLDTASAHHIVLRSRYYYTDTMPTIYKKKILLLYICHFCFGSDRYCSVKVTAAVCISGRGTRIIHATPKVSKEVKIYKVLLKLGSNWQ